MYGRGELTDEDVLADQVHEYEAQIAALERKVGQLTMVGWQELAPVLGHRGPSRRLAVVIIAGLRLVAPENSSVPPTGVLGVPGQEAAVASVPFRVRDWSVLWTACGRR